MVEAAEVVLIMSNLAKKTVKKMKGEDDLPIRSIKQMRYEKQRKRKQYQLGK